MSEAVFEILDRVSQLDNDDQKVYELQKASNKWFIELIKSCVNPNIKWDLPEGPAPFTPAPDVYTHNVLWAEIRRLYIFYENGPLKNNPSRREVLFIQLLEAIHPRDAALLQEIKDKKWPYENISMDVIDRAFPGIRD